MITMICLNGKNELELIVASRIGYNHAEKRFWFEMIGRDDVFYYENIESDLAAAAMKTALKQNGANLKSFGAYKVKHAESVAPAVPKACPRVAEKRAEVLTDTKIVLPVQTPKNTSKVKESASAEPIKHKPTISEGPSFMDKVTKVLDDGVKKAKNFAQEVAVVAEEESKKDKERSEARKAEWNAKKAALDEKVEERRARRTAAKAAMGVEEDEEEIRSEFDEIARGVAEAVEKAAEEVGAVNVTPAPVVDAETAVDVEAEIADIMANNVVSEPTEDELKEITQLNLDFSDIDEVMEDIM